MSKVKSKVFSGLISQRLFKCYCGLIVKKKGKYFGGLSTVWKVLSRKRIPLCSHHYDMLKNKQLCFSHLALSDKFVEAKIFLEDLYILKDNDQSDLNGWNFVFIYLPFWLWKFLYYNDLNGWNFAFIYLYSDCENS